MLNIVRADLYKMFKSSIMKVLFVIAALCSITMSAMAYSIQQGKLDVKMSGIGFMFGDANIMSILGAVIAGVFICSDFDNKTIHEAITCGCSRSAIIVSKAISFFCGLGVILLPYAIVTIIALCTGSKFSMGAVAVGFLNLIVKEAGTFTASKVAKLIIVILTLMIVYAAQISLCVLLAFVFKKPVLVVAVYYVVSFATAQLNAVKFSSKALKNIYECTPYGGKNAYLSLHSGSGDIIKAIVVSLIFIIIMLGLTHSVFRKAEVK
jgi:ABC-2 type transport system permease protein